MPLLRRLDAHRRDLAPPPETVNPSATPGPGRMTRCPSLSRRLPRFPFVLRTGSGVPSIVIGPRMAGHFLPAHPEITRPDDLTASGERQFLPGRRQVVTVATTRRTLPHGQRPAPRAFHLWRIPTRADRAPGSPSRRSPHRIPFTTVKLRHLISASPKRAFEKWCSIQGGGKVRLADEASARCSCSHERCRN